VTTGSAAEGAGDAPLASPGARWTREEDEELVAAVRVGADLAVIAEQHGWTRGAIVSRLLRMIPTRKAIVDLVGGVEWHSAELDHDPLHSAGPCGWAGCAISALGV
jgi:hypothetical protein